jgi:uncharacterized protein YfaS (alpha-2-macroglobulin family)
MLRAGRNTLEIKKSGVGHLFYVADLRYIDGQENIRSESHGIKISRSYYRLQRTHDQDGQPVYKPVALHGSLTPGETIECVITIQSPENYQYLLIEDPLPSGFEVVTNDQNRLFSWEGEWSDWADQDIYDNRVVVSRTYLSKGKQTIRYQLRPEMDGDFHCLPARIYAMYAPEINAHSSEARLSVR